MENWNDLMEYCDLTWSRYQRLKEAAAGTLNRMNLAMHDCMKEMIDPEMQITDYGRQVLSRAEIVMLGVRPKGPADGVVLNEINTAQAAYWLRKNGADWIVSVHLKMMFSLYKHPEQAQGHLVMTYGHRPLLELLAQEMVDGEDRLGAPFKLSEKGMLWIKNMIEIKTGNFESGMGDADVAVDMATPGSEKTIREVSDGKD